MTLLYGMVLPLMLKELLLDSEESYMKPDLTMSVSQLATLILGEFTTDAMLTALMSYHGLLDRPTMEDTK